MNAVELKDCPFCNDSDIRIGYSLDSECPYIECNGCGIEVKYSDCIKSTIQIWNMRPSEMDKVKA